MSAIELEESAAGVLSSDVSDALVKLASRACESAVLVRRGQHGSGSGIIWRSDGIVMTNQHVVAGRGRVQVTLSDDRELQASVVASDPTLDLAVLKVAVNDLPAAPFDPSPTLRIGQLVLAVGSPWGRRGVVTLGIVSGLGEVRAPWRSQPAEYVRSDVLLAPGNSGGALLDMCGNVVGINAMIFGGDLSVAIPSSIASQFVSLHERRPMLGVGVRAVRLPADLATRIGQERALEVVEVLQDGPAARVGCRAGDLMLKVDGTPLLDAQALQLVLSRYAAGARVTLDCVQNGALHSLTVDLQSMPTAEVTT